MDFSYEKPSDFPVDRFELTEEEGVLYRPEIVAKLKKKLIDGHPREGLFLRGPHGVGKSHSLVNLVRSLRADGHIVTFIPDCEDCQADADFLEFLLQSIGSSLRDIDLSAYSMTSRQLIHIIEFCEGILPTIDCTIDRKWFFVFDQINRIFARPQYQKAKNIGALPRPYALLKEINKRAGMKTVISASANNTVAYKDNHPGFAVEDHPTAMSREEVLLWKPDLQDLNDEQMRQLEEGTGFCPLQVARYLAGPSKFVSEGVADIVAAVSALLAEKKGDEITIASIRKAAVHCLLSLPVSDPVVLAYDRKYSVLKEERVVPLFPLVLVAYRQLFWDDVVKYIDENEGSILRVCGNASTTNDVRGRLFELIVVVRFIKSSLVSKSAFDALPARVDAGRKFESQKLPDPDLMERNTLFIPTNSNFPAIDLILKAGKDVWAVQVHVSTHPNVLAKFRTMCEEKGWFEAFDNINLVYLSPSDEVKNLLGTCIPTPPQRRSKRAKQHHRPIYVSAATIKDFHCLKSIQWTAPVTVDSTEPMET